MKDSRFKFLQPMIHPMVGAVGWIGRRVNVPTPMCDLLYAILVLYKNGPPGSLNLPAIRATGDLAGYSTE